MMSLKTACLLLLLLLSSACSQIQPAARSEDGLQKIAPPLLREVRVDPRLGRNMFGVDLRPEARILWAEIEGHYGRPVRELLIDDLAYSYYAGLASVDPDGTPVVQLTNTEPVTEERIVHELHHLKLYADGFPVIRIEYPAAWNGERQQARVRFLIAQIYDTIEHWIFYPRMREMGLMPDDTLKSNVEFNLQGGAEDEDVPGVTRRDSLTIEYFQAALLLSDEQLLRRLTNHYRGKRWDDGLNIGKAMAALVRAARPSTPKEAVTTLMRCLPVIERGINVYELSGWETEKIGEHDRRRVYLKVRSQSKRRNKLTP
jgi:hypothetical protein